MIVVSQGVRIEVLAQQNGAMCVIRCACQCSKGNEED